MAITTVDGIIAGAKPNRPFHKSITPTLVIGRPQSLWGLGGNPGAGSFDTTLAGVALSSASSPVNGQLVFDAGTSSSVFNYVSRFGGYSTGAGSHFYLCDRLWHNGGFTITLNTAQTVNSATFPARDEDGATSGKGVLLGLEISSAAGAAAPTITVSYTNSEGVSGRTGTNSFATANSPVAGAFFPIGLQAGDRGVRSVQSLTLSASWVSGTMNLVAYRLLASSDSISAGGGSSVDAVTGNLAKAYNGTVPFILVIPSATTAAHVHGHYGWTQG